jgi:hypothetical protein
MAEDNNAMAEEQIESTLVFDVEHYNDYEPFVRVAEGIHERGDRKVEYLYNLDTETDETVLRVQTRYYLDNELKNESGRDTQTYVVEDGVVQHAQGYELEQFIEDNFEVDPEVVLRDEFESMVDEA